MIVDLIDKALDERNTNVLASSYDIDSVRVDAAQEDRIFVRKCMKYLGERD